MANLVNPIQAILNNIDQQPILFIPDGPQALLLEVNNLSGQTLTLGSTSFFRMTFRPSTLVRAVPLTAIGQGALAALSPQSQGIQLVTSDPTAAAGSDLEAAAAEGLKWDLTAIAGTDGSVTVTLRPKTGTTRTLQPFDPTNARPSRLVLHFSNVQPAAAGQGTRSTPVDIQFSVTAVITTAATAGTPALLPVSGAGPTLPSAGGAGATPPAASAATITSQTELTGIEKAHLTLLNISRTAYLAEERISGITSAQTVPFGAEFIGSNNVFNDGQGSVLTLRVQNLTDDPLNLAVGLSRIELLFAAGDDPRPTPATKNIGVLVDTRGLLTSAPFAPVGVTSPWAWQTDSSLGIHQAMAAAATWPKGHEFQIQINIPAVTRQSGYARLGLKFSNLPDHPDGELELLVQAGPLFIDNEAAVGITRPLCFYGNSNTTKAGITPPPATIGIDNISGELNIQAPHNVKITGKLAAPRLRAGVLVAEDSFADTTVNPGNLRVQHKVTADAFETTAGFNLEMPKGTILMWSPPQGAGSVDFDDHHNVVATVAPAGWEICDGRAGTPDLRGRFMVGQGQYEEGNLSLGYSSGSIGGSGKVALVEPEIPSHTHSFNDLTAAAAPNPPEGVSFLSQSIQVFTPNHTTTFFKTATPPGTIAIGQTNVSLSTFGGGPDDSHAVTGGPTVSHENRPPFFVVVYIMKMI